MRYQAHTHFLQAYGYALLGAIMLIYLLVVSLQPETSRSPFTAGILVAAIVAGSFATSHSPKRAWITFALALLVLLRLLIEQLSTRASFLEIGGQLWFWWVTGCMVFDVVRGRMRVMPRLLAAGSLYVMAAVGFGEIYALLDRPRPDAQTPFTVNGHARQLAVEELVYFSFTTQTTLGYGDILPVSRPARTVAIVQSTAGVLYLAVLVASIVNARSEPPTTGPDR